MKAKRKAISSARPNAPRALSVRVFLSSTFRDFGEERDLLVRQVFPALRARLKDRFVEIVDVDLRWGITEEEAERGDVLPICLAEIDRARPYFIGMLGERYGWIPPVQGYSAALIEREPWLKIHQGGKSVTELEILHGVLNRPKMAGRAFFYFRAASYSKKKKGDYLPSSLEDSLKQRELKTRIRNSGFPLVQYRDPQAFAKRLEKDLWKLFDAEFPAHLVPDAFEKEVMRHESYAAPRRRLYLGGERYFENLDASLDKNKQWVLIEGASGGGKSALIANWIAANRKAHPKDLIHEHYLGASADAAKPQALVKRLIEAIQRKTQSIEAIPSDPQELLDSLPTWLAIASAWATKNRKRWLVAFDSLNSLTDLRDLRWFPDFLPARIHLVVSCSPGEVLNALMQKVKNDTWAHIVVKPLSPVQRKELLVTYLARFNKTLPSALLKSVLSHDLSNNPLFLRTLAEELRLFGVHEELEERVNYYLKSATVDDLFERVLERVEEDCGEKAIRETMAAIWGSRAGLTEVEILGICKLVPATWAPIRNALDESLLESNGRLTFAHDYLRNSVQDRYLDTKDKQRAIHLLLGAWFSNLSADLRRVEEEPYQWWQGMQWKKLKACLTERSMFAMLFEHVSKEEHWGYWLALEENTKARVELAYKKAFSGWGLNHLDQSTGDLAGAIGQMLLYAGRYGNFTKEMFRTSIEVSERTKGPEHPETGVKINNLAVLLNATGDYAAAEPLYRRALVIAEKTQGLGHPETARSLNNLASLLKAMGANKAAEPLYRRALAIAEKEQGANHPETGVGINNLAALLYAMGDYEAAEPLYRKALAIAEKVQGPDHPETGSCLNNLALLLKAMGNYQAAESLYRRALAIAEKARGPEHPEVGSTINNLALLLKVMGNAEAAEPMYRRALAIAEKTQGPEHPETGIRLNNLAVLLKGMGAYDASEPLYRRALAISEKVLGPEHPETGVRINNLAALLKAKGDHKAAESLYRRSLTITEKALGANHPSTGTILNNLAFLLKDMGDYTAAESIFRRALVVAEKVQGPEHPKTASLLYALGELLLDLGKLTEAKKFLIREIELTRKFVKDDFDPLVTSLQNFGVALRNAGELKEAEPYLVEALQISERFYAKDSMDITPQLSAVGQLRFLQKRYEEAHALFTRCLEIRRANLPVDDAQVTNVQARISELNVAMASK